MKHASIRQVQHSFKELLGEVERGHDVLITKRGVVVAKLVRAQVAKVAKPVWPNFKARMNALFPDGPPTGIAASEIILADRADRA